MALIDKLNELQSSLSAIKTALSNKGVSVSSLKADQVATNINKIVTNPVQTKNMGTQSVTFKEPTYTINYWFASCISFNSSNALTHGYDLTTRNSLYLADSSSSGTKYYLAATNNKRCFAHYSTPQALMDGYRAALSNGGTWTGATIKDGYRCNGIQGSISGIPKGTYYIYCNYLSGATTKYAQQMGSISVTVNGNISLCVASVISSVQKVS